VLKGVFCRLFKHKFIVKKQVTPSVKEYLCRRCGKQYTTSGDGSLTPLTPKRLEINKELERLHKVRTRRRKQKMFYS